LKKNRNNLQKIGDLIEGHTKYALILFIIMLLAAIAEGVGLSLVLPLLSGLVGIKDYSSNFSEYILILSPLPEKYRIEGLLLFLLIVFFLKSVLMVLHRGLSVNFAMQLRETWSNKIFSKYLGMPYEKIMNQRRGESINNIVIEPFRASKSITMLLELGSKLTLSITLLTLLLLTEWKFTLLVAFGGGTIFYFLRNIIDRYSIKFGKERLDLNQHITAIATEGISAIREIKIFGSAHTHIIKLSKKLARYTKIHTIFAVLSDLPRHVIEFTAILFITIILGYVHIVQNIEFKNILPFLGFFVLVCQRLLVYISFIISHRMKIVSFFPSLSLIHSEIYEKRMVEDNFKKTKLDTLKHDIIFKNVTFSYEDGKPVFYNLNLTIPHGKITAIIGASGIGKSTIADLILRLFVPQRGEILVNGKDINQFDLLSWRSKIGYVSQEPFIFNTTIKENILIGKPSARKDEVINAAKMANIHDFIQTLSDGYDTIVGDDGFKLSGGQKQRIAIARAIIRDPDLFIFDEATSSLDKESEKMIQQSIKKLSQSKTILIIAHRISTLENADIIYQINSKGKTEIIDYDSLKNRA